MADSAANRKRSFNPLALHLQKLALELKCPLCLNLFSRPLLLPCDHIFCNSCVPRSAQCDSECPLCKSQCSYADLRPLAFLENIIAIYKGLDALPSSNLLQPVYSAFGRHQEDNSSSGQSLLANTLVQVSFNNSACDGQKGKGFELTGMGENKRDGGQNPNSAQPSSHTQAGGIRDCRPAQMDVNQLDQLSPCSPPSFGDIKGSDNESNDQGGELSPESYLANRSVKRGFDDRTRQEHRLYSSETAGSCRDSKRLKSFNYGPDSVGVKSSGHSQSTVFRSESLVASKSDSELKSVAALASEKMPPISNDSCANNYICGFCQSARISEVTGLMLHYANGKPVVGEEADRSHVIHVHSKCIEWAPKVYYVGDTVKNLKAELARGSKLKCSRCGLKGAALGCYVKSCRRSYHVPCALEISECRWDTENFLVLCPVHSSVKFPIEKSGHRSIRNRAVPLQLTPQEPSFWGSSPNKAKEWVFCGSALSVEEKLLLVRFGSMIGVPVSKFWKPNVTHVIAATDAKGSCTRTLKVLMAILNGNWVLKIDWIKACMEAMNPVGEEPYEINLDNHGCEDGPKTGRLRALNKAPKLLDGLSFYFSGNFMLGYKEDLQSLVITAGGTIWKSEGELLAQCCNDETAPSKVLVVYNLDFPEGSLIGEEVSTIWKRLNEAEELASKIGCRVIGHTWLLESIAAHKLQPFLS
ncbi:hypothetical protein AB3S75_026369 [Citrus x aurantiifolia]